MDNLLILIGTICFVLYFLHILIIGYNDVTKKDINSLPEMGREIKKLIKGKTPFQKIVYASIDEFFLQLEYGDVLVLEAEGLKRSLIKYFNNLSDEGWQKLREQGTAEQIVPTMVSRIIKRQLLSGGLHIYRGFLGDEGRYYLDAYKFIGNYRISKGFISAEDFAQELADIEEQLSEIG